MDTKNVPGPIVKPTNTPVKPKKDRKPPIKYATISKVEKMVREGKTKDEMVATGISQKEVNIAIKKLKAEGLIKEAYVAVQ